MIIVGADYHPAFQQIAFVDSERTSCDSSTAREREVLPRSRSTRDEVARGDGSKVACAGLSDCWRNCTLSCGSVTQPRSGLIASQCHRSHLGDGWSQSVACLQVLMPAFEQIRTRRNKISGWLVNFRYVGSHLFRRKEWQLACPMYGANSGRIVVAYPPTVPLLDDHTRCRLNESPDTLHPWNDPQLKVGDPERLSAPEG